MEWERIVNYCHATTETLKVAFNSDQYDDLIDLIYFQKKHKTNFNVPLSVPNNKKKSYILIHILNPANKTSAINLVGVSYWTMF